MHGHEYVAHAHEYIAHLSMRSALSSVNCSKIKSPGRYVSSRASYELRYLLAGYKDSHLQAAHAYDTRLRIHSNNPCLSLITSLVIAWTEIYRGCLFCVRAIHAKWTYSNSLRSQAATECLILYPFEHLLSQLQDGTVPYVCLDCFSCSEGLLDERP